MRVLLVSTYELGRQPFGLASPAAWLAARGHQVTCADLSIEAPPAEAVRDAGLIAFSLPMHTATRLAVIAIQKFRRLNADAHYCCYGLYAALNEPICESWESRPFWAASSSRGWFRWRIGWKVAARNHSENQ